MPCLCVISWHFLICLSLGKVSGLSLLIGLPCRFSFDSYFIWKQWMSLSSFQGTCMEWSLSGSVTEVMPYIVQRRDSVYTAAQPMHSTLHICCSCHQNKFMPSCSLLKCLEQTLIWSVTLNSLPTSLHMATIHFLSSSLSSGNLWEDVLMPSSL